MRENRVPLNPCISAEVFVRVAKPREKLKTSASLNPSESLNTSLFIVSVFRVHLMKALSSNYGLLRTSWRIQAELFFQQSSLHGVKYIAENGRPFLERWVKINSLGLFKCGVDSRAIWVSGDDVASH